MVTALNVANNFLERSFNEKVPLSPMKLQKLIYILYKTYLKQTGYKLFSEMFEAWEYGPVLPNVHNEFENFQSNPITTYALNSNNSVTKVELLEGTDFYDIFNEVWKTYKNYNGVTLSETTRQLGGAWQKSIDNKIYILHDSDIEREA